jgi:hypothetical protein
MQNDNQKTRKKREAADYFVVVNNEKSIAKFKTHSSAIKFIKYELSPRNYDITEGDQIQVIKQVMKVMSTHKLQPTTVLKASQLI